TAAGRGAERAIRLATSFCAPLSCTLVSGGPVPTGARVFGTLESAREWRACHGNVSSSARVGARAEGERDGTGDRDWSPDPAATRASCVAGEPPGSGVLAAGGEGGVRRAAGGGERRAGVAATAHRWAIRSEPFRRDHGRERAEGVAAAACLRAGDD